MSGGECASGGVARRAVRYIGIGREKMKAKKVGAFTCRDRFGRRRRRRCFVPRMVRSPVSHSAYFLAIELRLEGSR